MSEQVSGMLLDMVTIAGGILLALAVVVAVAFMWAMAPTILRMTVILLIAMTVAFAVTHGVMAANGTYNRDLLGAGTVIGGVVILLLCCGLRALLRPLPKS